MTTDTRETMRRTFYEIAERIAPSWARRRAQVEEVSTPVREWLLRELRPRAGDTVLEMTDPEAALAETRRVLRPGGRLALSVWGAPERNPFFATIAVSLLQRGHIDPTPPSPAPGPFSMADAERIEAQLRGAGFENVRTEEVPLHFPAPDVNEYLSLTADTAGPLGLALQALPESECAAAS